MNYLSLYQITEEAEALSKIIELDEGEITEETEELIKEVESLVANKTDKVVGVYNFLTDQIEAAEKRKQEIDNFIRARKNAQERLKGYVANCMDRLGAKSFEGELYEIKERKPTKVLDITNENDVPPEFLIVETVVKVDKRALKKAVQNGLVDHPSIGLVDSKRSILFKIKAVK